MAWAIVQVMVGLAEHEWSTAPSRLREALSYYRKIGSKTGEVETIRMLGELSRAGSMSWQNVTIPNA